MSKKHKHHYNKMTPTKFDHKLDLMATCYAEHFFKVVNPLFGFKKVYVDGRPAIANLIIPVGATVFMWGKRNNYAGKIRATEAYVHSIEFLFLKSRSHKPPTKAYSWYDHDFIYKVGKTVFPDCFDSHSGECSHGIHFFLSLNSAKAFMA